MRPAQSRTFGACKLVVAALLIGGCGDDTASPIAPSPVAKPSASTAPSDAIAAGASVFPPREEGVSLKATKPVSLDPVGGTEIEVLRPLLVASNASGFVDADFGYEFSIWHDAGSGALTEVEAGVGTPRDAGSTSYQVQGPLTPGLTYSWRVRAIFEDAVGPWSDHASFRIAPVRFGAPLELVGPLGGSTVSNRPGFVVRSGQVEGETERIVVQVRLAPEGTELTDARIIAEAATGKDTGEEVSLELPGDYRMVSDTSYVWQARTVAYSASSRTFRSAWSDHASFRTQVQRLGAPQPVAPLDGTTVDRRPTFRVRNGAVEGDLGRIVIRIEVASDAGFSDSVVGEAEAQGVAGAESSVRLREVLQPQKAYFWRASAEAPDAPFGAVFSPPSDPVVEFNTRGGIALGPVRNPPPNLMNIVKRVVDRHPRALRATIRAGAAGVPSGPDDPDWELLRLVISELQEVDGGRWGGTYRTPPGKPPYLSKERLAYYLGEGDPRGSTNIRVIEFIHWKTETVVWWDSTEDLRKKYPQTKGVWIDPRE